LTRRGWANITKKEHSQEIRNVNTSRGGIMNLFRNRLGRVFVLFLIAAVAVGCGRKPEGGGPKTPVVRVVPVKVESIIDYEYFTGRSAAIENVEVRARVTGYLVSIDFTSGAEVKKDQRLFQIDPRPYKATLDQAKAQVVLAEAQLKLAIADNARAVELAKTPGAISKQDLDKYAAAQDQASAAVQANKASAESAELNLKFTDVLSPIDGSVGRNLLTLGNLINQDTTLLTTVVSEDPIYGYFDVDERTMLNVQELIREGKIKSAKEGQFPVEYGLANEKEEYPHKGVVDFVNTQVDSSTGTLQVRGVFKNPVAGPGKPRLLRPGMFLRIRVPLGEPHKALIVPQAAIGRDQAKKFLLVVDDKGVIEYRPITLGSEQPGGKQAVNPVMIVRSEKDFRVAKPGEKGEPSLKAGEKIIVGGLQKVRPGMTVEAKPADETAK
jgi:membrane fusion protein, multidrug efflux system